MGPGSAHTGLDKPHCGINTTRFGVSSSACCRLFVECTNITVRLPGTASLSKMGITGKERNSKSRRTAGSVRLRLNRHRTATSPCRDGEQDADNQDNDRQAAGFSGCSSSGVAARAPDVRPCRKRCSATGPSPSRGRSLAPGQTPKSLPCQFHCEGTCRRPCFDPSVGKGHHEMPATLGE